MHRRKFINQAAIASLVLAGLDRCSVDTVTTPAIPNTSGCDTSAAYCMNGDISMMDLFPSTNYWHKKITSLNVDPESAALLAFHSYNGNYSAVVIENSFVYNVVNNLTPTVKVLDHYQPTTDPSKYLFPIMPEMPLQHGIYLPAPNNVSDGAATDGADHHLIIVDKVTKKLYELYQPHQLSDGSYECWGSAIFDLADYAKRFPTNSSSDAAGFPILAGTLTYEDLTSSQPINHALRMTIHTPRPDMWLPAVSHNYGGDPTRGLPMGARLRLKPGTDIEAGASQPMPTLHKKIITCLKEYGAIICDGGNNYAVAAIADPRLKKLDWYVEEANGESSFNLCDRYIVRNGDNVCVHGNDFEVVDRNQSAAL